MECSNKNNEKQDDIQKLVEKQNMQFRALTEALRHSSK